MSNYCAVYLPCFFAPGGSNPASYAALENVKDAADNYSKSLTRDLYDRNNRAKKKGFNAKQSVRFPAPHYTNPRNTISKIKLNINPNYSIIALDEYFGDIGWGEKWFYGNYASLFWYPFNDNEEPWIDDSNNDNKFKSPSEQWFEKCIAPLYKDVDYKPINILHSSDIWSKKREKNDMFLSKLAFSGYAAHYTKPYVADNDKLLSQEINDNSNINIIPEQSDIAYISDLSFLSKYEVRSRYDKYGAIAYFDFEYKILAIYVCHLKKFEKVPEDENNTTVAWEHAKWVWRVSVSVASFLREYIGVTRFLECNAFIQSILESFDANHPIRRLVTPFMYGTVYSNRIINEWLLENSLYHRAFAFTYNGLCKCIKDAMEEHVFKVFVKRLEPMKNVPQSIYPMHEDMKRFYSLALRYVLSFLDLYYKNDPPSKNKELKEDNDSDDDNNNNNNNNNDDDDDDDDNDDNKNNKNNKNNNSNLQDMSQDAQVKNFHKILIKKLKIDSKFRVKKFNISRLLTHFLCITTVWNKHLSDSVSFFYSADFNFTGLKIIGNNLNENSIQSYMQYCNVVLSKGWNYPTLYSDVIKGWDVIGKGMGDKKDEIEAIVNEFAKDLGIYDGLINNTNNENEKRSKYYNSLLSKYLSASFYYD